MKKFAIFLFALLSLATVSGQSHIEILTKSATETTLSLELKDITQTAVATQTGAAVIIGFENGTPLLQEGSPDLAKFATSLQIPNAGNMALEIVRAEFKEFENVQVAPSKGNLLRKVDPATVPYNFGPAYERNAFFPGQLADLQQAFIMRDLRGQNLWIYPVQYNPATKTLRVYTNITLRVYQTSTAGENELKPVSGRQISPMFKQLYQKLFLNFDENLLSGSRSGNEPEKMLIIANDEFIPSLDQYVTWKRQMGIHTTVVPVSEAGGNPSAVFTYVQNYYNEHRISYLLLVGDENALTPLVRPGSVYSCDNCLGYMEGSDHFPEIFVGRFNAETQDQLNIILNRNLEYERSPLIDSSLNWLATGMASTSEQGQGIGDDNQADYEQGNEWKAKQLADGYEKYWEFYDGSQAAISPTPGDETADAPGNPVNTQLVDLMNGRGISLYNYTGHGWEQGLSSGNFNTNAVATLRNNHRYPIVIAVACCAGNFTNNGGGDCLGEALQRAGNQFTGEAWGAVAGFFSSDFQSWAPPMEGQDGMNQYLIDADGVTLDPNLGSMAAYGNALMIAAYGQGGIDMADVWNPFLDPSTVPRTAIPLSLSATHPAGVVIGTTSMTVACDVEGAQISLFWQGQTIAVGTVSSGVALLEFPSLENVGTITLTATHFNRLPYQGVITVNPAAGAYVINESITLDDAAGNNNQSADYGETIALNLKLSNLGDQLANATNVTLSTNDDLVTITDATELFGDILAGGNLEIPAAFQFEVAKDITDGHVVPFKLLIEFNSGQVYESAIPIKLLAPKLSVGTIQLQDNLVGDADGRLESSEVATITVKNLNLGHSTSPAGLGTLSCNSPWLSISNGVVVSPLDPLTGTADAVFTVTVSADAPQSFPVYFNYSVTADDYFAEKQFAPVTVNAILETFETQNFNSFPWEMSGNKPWFVTPTAAYTGQYSSRSGQITHNQQSVMEMTLNFTTDGVLTFARRVSSEQDYDFLRFLIDDSQMDAWSGLVPWEEMTYPLSSGIHKLSWIYEKDNLGNSNSDRAWIDDISLPPHEVLVATHTPEQAGFEAMVSPNPSAGNAWLELNLSQSQTLDIALFDCLGHKVQYYQTPTRALSGAFRMELQLTSLPSGLYFLHLQGETGTRVLKLVKE